MVYKSYIYTIRSLKQTFRNWEAYIQIFVLPVILLSAFAWLYGEESGYDVGYEHRDTFKVGVINQDNFSSLLHIMTEFNPYLHNLDIIGDPLEEGFGSVFIKNVNYSNKLLDENELRQMSLIEFKNLDLAAQAVQNRFLSLCFIIPINFSQTILAGINHKINITHKHTVSNSPNLIFSEAEVELIGDITYSRFTEATSLLETQLNNFMFCFTGLETTSKIELEYLQISSVNFTEFHSFIPAFLVMTLLMSSAGITYILGFERERGTIDKLKLSNFSTRDLIFGVSFTQFITISLQIFVFFITVYFLGFPGRIDLILAFFISLISIIPVLSIGFLASIYLEGDIAFYVPGLAAIPLSFLTGSFIPLPKIQIMGEIQIWHINPFYSLSEAIRKILFLRYDLTQILFEIFLLMVVALPFFILSTLAFSKRIYQIEYNT